MYRYIRKCVNKYLLTPWSTVRLEKLTVPQPVKKFPTFYGTRRFITAFTSARHLSLSKLSVQVRGFLSEHFVTWYEFKVRGCLHLVQPQSSNTTPCRLSATVYSIYSQLLSILEAFPPSATWRRAMPCWQGPTDHGSINTTTKIYWIYAADLTEGYILWRHKTLCFCKTAYTKRPSVPSRKLLGYVTLAAVDLRSLRRVDRYFAADVSGQPIGPIKGQAVQESDPWRNNRQTVPKVGNKPPINAA